MKSLAGKTLAQGPRRETVSRILFALVNVAVDSSWMAQSVVFADLASRRITVAVTCIVTSPGKPGATFTRVATEALARGLVSVVAIFVMNVVFVKLMFLEHQRASQELRTTRLLRYPVTAPRSALKSATPATRTQTALPLENVHTLQIIAWSAARRTTMNAHSVADIFQAPRLIACRWVAQSPVIRLCEKSLLQPVRRIASPRATHALRLVLLLDAWMGVPLWILTPTLKDPREYRVQVARDAPTLASSKLAERLATSTIPGIPGRFPITARPATAIATTIAAVARFAMLKASV